MKRIMGLALVMVGLVGTACAEMVSLIQITDMRGTVGYEVMTREQYADLMKQLKEEGAAYPVAFAESKKEWEADKENKLPFQGNRIKPRSAKKVGDFPDQDKASKKKDTLEERASEKQLAEMDKGKEKDKGKKGKQSKPNEEDVAKELARQKAFDDALGMISKRMGDKLGRPVPSFGFAVEEPKKEEGKKDVKKEEKKEEKKDEKKEAKKEEKK